MSNEEPKVKEKVEPPHGIFRCGPCDWSSDLKKTPAEQEEQLYQHNRDVEHEGIRYSKRCQNCRKKLTGIVKGKVPQPYVNEEGKKVFPRSIIVFCKNNDKCKKEYLKKIGVTT